MVYVVLRDAELYYACIDKNEALETCYQTTGHVKLVKIDGIEQRIIYTRFT